jgi:hypothetical protein
MRWQQWLPWSLWSELLVLGDENHFFLKCILIVVLLMLLDCPWALFGMASRAIFLKEVSAVIPDSASSSNIWEVLCIEKTAWKAILLLMQAGRRRWLLQRGLCRVWRFSGVLYLESHSSPFPPTHPHPHPPFPLSWIVSKINDSLKSCGLDKVTARLFGECLHGHPSLKTLE